MPHPITGPLTAFAARLRFPTLFKLTLGLMLLSWLLPDPIPFIDEIVTALATLMLASWRRRDEPPGSGKVIDGESRRE